MRFRTFGDTDIRASEIGFGAWAIATDWWGKIEKRDALNLLQQSFDLGVTFIDTSDTYGKGYSEELIAEALSAQRGELTIATKFGYDIYTAEDPGRHIERAQKWEPEYVRHALEQSLRRLNTDYIDLYQLHNPKLNAVENDELFTELDKFVNEGKVRGFGVALGPAIGWEEEGVMALRERHVAAVQTVYNLLEQDPGRNLIQEAKTAGAGILSRVPLHSGMLQGVYGEDKPIPSGSHRNFRLRVEPEWIAEGLEKVNQLSFLTEGTGRTLAQASLKFILSDPMITSILPTITNAEELAEFAAASDGVADLTSDELARISELYESGFKAVPA